MANNDAPRQTTFDQQTRFTQLRESLLAAIATGDDNLRLWCIRNRAALRIALIFEGMEPPELARGAALLLRELFDWMESHGTDHFPLGDSELARMIGINRKTARAWIDAALAWGILAEHGRGQGRPSELRIEWHPILLRIRAAAAANEIDDHRLFQFTPDAQPAPSTDKPAPPATQLVPSLDKLDTSPAPTHEEEDKSISAPHRPPTIPPTPPQVINAITDLRRENQTTHADHQLTLIRIEAKVDRLAPSPSRATPLSNRDTTTPDWSAALTLLKNAKVSRNERLARETPWTPVQVVTILRHSASLAIDGTPRIAPGLIRTHLIDDDPGAPFGPARMSTEFAAAFEQLRDNVQRSRDYRASVLSTFDDAGRREFESKFGKLPVSAASVYTPSNGGVRPQLCQVDILAGFRKVPKSARQPGAAHNQAAAPWRPSLQQDTAQ